MTKIGSHIDKGADSPAVVYEELQHHRKWIHPSELADVWVIVTSWEGDDNLPLQLWRLMSHEVNAHEIVTRGYRTHGYFLVRVVTAGARLANCSKSRNRPSAWQAHKRALVV